MARGHLCLLELALLEEAKRVRLAPGARAALSQDSRWTGNNPMSLDLFDAAVDLSGTRDPFDRLIVAHAPL
jgi:PIN domain nuclease of toxin-antitoxin system